MQSIAKEKKLPQCHPSRASQGAPDGKKEMGMMGTWADACINPNCISALPGAAESEKRK
jgi:hypothetical protein